MRRWLIGALILLSLACASSNTEVESVALTPALPGAVVSQPSAPAGVMVSKPSAASVAGLNFRENAPQPEYVEGCEGCGNLGSWDFSADGSVKVLQPGSDIREGGTWTQSGAVVTVVLEGKKREFTFDGKTLIDTRYKTPYVIK